MGFTSPPDPRAFDAGVYRVVRRIPPGKVMTYGQIAQLIRRPRGVTVRRYAGLGARWVGSAMARAPDYVPWHRVINGTGRLSARASGGEAGQAGLLEAEGVRFDARGRVDLDSHQFVPRRR